MTGRNTRPSRPKLPATGRGWRQDEASGFVRLADDYVEDVRQGATAPEFADLTPGFGTYHPQDVVDLGELSDPTPIDNAQTITEPLSKQDLGISDQEIRASIQEGRAPRRGY